MTVYGYVRVSTTEQVDNTSMQEQKRQIEGNAMSHNLVIDQFI
jgi:DNA invertase Pin-like site-specific DNA recombinase